MFDFISNPNGFGNYQYVINQSRDGQTMSIERFNSNNFNDRTLVGYVTYEMVGNQMQIAVPRSLLGISGDIINLSFKWADNVADMNNPESYYKTGEVAPLGMTNYHFWSQDY